MADKWPVTTPMNWSSAADWNGGTKPQPGDDVYADGKTVTIDEDVTVASLRTTQRGGGTIGGIFKTTNNTPTSITIQADLFAGYAYWGLLLYGSGTVNLIGNGTGNVNGGAVSADANFSGTLNWLGNYRPGAYNGYGLYVGVSTGVFNVTGNYVSPGAGSAGTIGISVYNSPNAVVNVIGSIEAGPGPFTYDMGMQINNGVVNFVGDMVSAGGVCCWLYNGTLNVVGDVYASSASPAIYSSSQNNPNGLLKLDGNAIPASNGMAAVACLKVLIHATNPQTHTYRVNNNGSPGAARSLYTGGQNLGQPDEADVREDTLFGVSNEYRGTLAVPSPATVSLGVPTDDTTGTLVVSLEDILAAGSQLGAGAWLVQLTFTDLDTGEPVQNANVRLSANGVGSRVVLTDVNGVAEFSADSATYDVTATANGYTFAPTTLVVAGNVAQSYDMTPASWPASAEPDSVTLRYRVYDYATRQPVGANDAVVYLKIHTVPDVDGTLWQRVADSCSTDADGYVYFPNVPKASVVDVREGTKGDWRQITVPADATSPYDPEAILGRAYA